MIEGSRSTRALIKSEALERLVLVEEARDE